MIASIEAWQIPGTLGGIFGGRRVIGRHLFIPQARAAAKVALGSASVPGWAYGQKIPVSPFPQKLPGVLTNV